jgi:succinate dehydrogenase / fumarate reductase flavoprotein subunit
MLEFDVLVVGSGGAGLRAAIAAKETDPGLAVAVVTKGRLDSAGVTATACSDRMAFHATLEHTEPHGDPEAWRYHAEDIYRIGGYVSDADLAVTLARGAGEAFHYLDGLGVPFATRDDGLADQFVTDGSKYARACYTGPHTANHIHQALARRVRELDVTLLEDRMAADLLLAPGGAVAGAVLADGATVRAKAVVLATGGAGAAWKVHVFPERMTGDGFAMALRAGAELVSMEFIQIGLSSVKTKLACSGSMMRSFPRLVDEAGREFLRDYFEADTPWEEIYSVLFRKGASWPVSYEEASHVIDIAVYSEMMNGHIVYLDYSRNAEGFDIGKLNPKLWARFEGMSELDMAEPPLSESPLARLKAINAPSVEWLRERGVDLDRGDRIELAPAIQHFQGGVKINPRAEASLRGLYAAGECAGGQHGANRPGGNALMDSQVMGKIAGMQAAVCAAVCAAQREFADGNPPTGALAESADGMKVTDVAAGVRDLMSRYASIKRSVSGTSAALKELRRLAASAWDAGDADERAVQETRNIVTVAEAVLAACAARPESRGPHLFFESQASNTPLPKQDPEWRKYLVIRREGAKLAVEPRMPVQADWDQLPEAVD